MTVPSSYSSSGYTEGTDRKYGLFTGSTSAPSLYKSTEIAEALITSAKPTASCSESSTRYLAYGKMNHCLEKEYRWTPSGYVAADFPYDSYSGQWVSMRITLKNNKIYSFVNGDLVGSGAFTKPTANDFYIKSSGTVNLDELRVTTGSLSSISSYDSADAPYDTNKVLALTDTLVANTLYVQSSTTVNGYRVGGVRPSNPSNGFFYVPLYSDYTAAQPQMYVNGNWVSVSAVVYDETSTKDVLGFKFSPPGASPDVNLDLEPGHPDKPPLKPSICTHEWKLSSIAEHGNQFCKQPEKEVK